MARGKPFSGKKKKDQLKEKKERKRIENAILENNLDISIQEKRKMAKELIKSNANKSINNNEYILSSKIITQKGNNNNNNNNNDSDSNEDGSDSNEDYDNNEINTDEENEDNEKSLSHIKEINKQMEKFDKNGNIGGRRINKLVTIFEKESKDEIELRKQISKKPLDTTLREKPWLIMNEYNSKEGDNNYNSNNNNNFIDIPKRPKWNYSMSAEKLKEEERQMFSNWLGDMVKNYEKNRLNYFEHNLEVWRQLWRVSERSDVILLITDARYPLFHFPPSLYNYIHNDLKKPMILVLNKIDLVNKKIINLWIEYFNKNYPSLKVICFSSFSSYDSNQDDNNTVETIDSMKKRKLKKGRKRYDLSKGKQSLIEAIKSLSTLDIEKSNLITQDDLNENNQKEKQDSGIGDEQDDDTDEDDNEESEFDYDDDYNSYYSDYVNDEKKKEIKNNNKQQQQDFITIGMVGHPNVGKSSLINGLMGKKVVSTSRTPGHTKHFQTIVFSKNIQLLDCPGLVFPALDRPKQLQILCGLFPIAQVREPFSAIQYLAERVPVEKIYRLKNPHDEDGDREPWSAYSICEAFALKRGYLIAKSGRPDPHRAGLELLKDCVDGNIVISWPPPGFTKDDYLKLMAENKEDHNDHHHKHHIKKDNKSKTLSKYNKKLKKKNNLNRIAYSDEEQEEQEINNQDQSDETVETDETDEDEKEDNEIDDDSLIDKIKFVKSNNPSTFSALNSSNDDNDESDDMDESDDYSEIEDQDQDENENEEEEDEEEEEEEDTKKPPKQNTNKTTKSTSPKTTASNNNNNKNNNKCSTSKNRKKKGNIKHESEYQERLREKQNKGGNKRQII